MKYKNWKQILTLALGFTLVFEPAAYASASVTMISVPFETAAEERDNQTSGIEGAVNAGGNSGHQSEEVQQTPGVGHDGGKGNVVVAGGGQNMSSLLTQQTPSLGAAGQTSSGVLTAPLPSASSQQTGNSASQATTSSQETTASQENLQNQGSTSAAQVSQPELTKPEIASEGAVLMDAATGQVLFGKNEHQQFYPASITKVMTALLVLERCRLDEVVTFSKTATTNLESGASALGIVEGDQLTVEQCLYGFLLKSANEIGNGLAEHVAGSISGFADLMNQKARALGCQNTNFVNPHGLNNTEHKTTPYDMALILREALKNPTFRKIDTTRVYDFPATKEAEARTITMGHKMMYPSDSRYYEGIIGGKTGYTSKAGNTLVTGVERDGVRLVAVVMKSQSTHYPDTKKMLDFGFQNYEALTGHRAGSLPLENGGSGFAGNIGPAGSESTVQNTTVQNTAAQNTMSQNTTAQNTTVQNTAAQDTAAQNHTAQSQPAQTGWVQDSTGWYYLESDGSRASGEWLTLEGYDYWFDSNGYMATGWRQFTNGAWYYFRPNNGVMARNRWVEDGGAWYYLGDDGVLLTNTTTPDGYPVDENGIWIQ